MRWRPRISIFSPGKKAAVLLLLIFFSLVACAPRQTLKPVKPEEAREKYQQLRRISSKVLPVIDKENFKDYKAVIADSPNVNAFAQCEDKLVIVFAGAFDEFTAHTPI